MSDFIDIKGWQIFLMFAYFYIFYLILTTFVMIIGAFFVFLRFRKIPVENIYSILQSNSLPDITFLSPAYNEENVIIRTVETLLNLSYGSKKIIIINDGSTDATLDLLKDRFSLERIPISSSFELKTKTIKNYFASREYPDLLVIDKENGGKADALNAGVNACNSSHFVATDADTIVDDIAFNRLIRPFLQDPRTKAANSSVGVFNSSTFHENGTLNIRFPKKLLPGYQALEYMKSFLLEKVGVNWTRGALVIPGPFGLFIKDVVVEIGGYDPRSIVEDQELVTRMHAYLLSRDIDYKIAFIPDTIAWTIVPEQIDNLIKQRLRWYKGSIEVTIDYLYMLFNPKYKSIGCFVFPMSVFEKIAPVIELISYLVMIGSALIFEIDVKFALIILLFFWLFGVFVMVFTLFVDVIAMQTYSRFIDYLRYLRAALLYPFYHYILMYCRIQGFFFKRNKNYHWETAREKRLE
ncbi:MAG: glycosyltransferase [Waddliaceae bacterium]